MTRRGAAVFLDRDGVVVEDVGHATGVEQLRLLPGAAAGIRALRGMGYRVAVITNQSVIARGMLDLAGLQLMHSALAGALLSAGAPVDGFWVCPHHPSGTVEELARACDCRKPAPGLVLRAAAALGVALDRRSAFVGDQLSDLACGVAAGIRPVLVLTGKGAAVEVEARRRFPGLDVAPDLSQVPHLLRG